MKPRAHSPLRILLAFVLWMSLLLVAGDRLSPIYAESLIPPINAALAVEGLPVSVQLHGEILSLRNGAGRQYTLSLIGSATLGTTVLGALQAIGVPAHTNRWVWTDASVGVVGAGLAQQLELRVGEGRQGTAQLPCQTRTASPMAGIPVLVRPPGVVEEGEQVYHQRIGSHRLRQSSPVLKHPPPVGQPMDSHLRS